MTARLMTSSPSRVTVGPPLLAVARLWQAAPHGSPACLASARPIAGIVPTLTPHRTAAASKTSMGRAGSLADGLRGDAELPAEAVDLLLLGHPAAGAAAVHTGEGAIVVTEAGGAPSWVHSVPTVFAHSADCTSPRHAAVHANRADQEAATADADSMSQLAPDGTSSHVGHSTATARSSEMSALPAARYRPDEWPEAGGTRRPRAAYRRGLGGVVAEPKLWWSQGDSNP